MWNHLSLSVKVVYPLKQGLKHIIPSSSAPNSISVKVVYPLKQGLKQGDDYENTKHRTSVKVVYPLKQGLKRENVMTYTLSTIKG